MPSVKTLVTMRKLSDDANRWLNQVPNEINDAFFDNPFVNALENTITAMMVECYGEDLEPVISDVVRGAPLSENNAITFTHDDGERYRVASMDELCDYLIQHRGWTE